MAITVTVKRFPRVTITIKNAATSQTEIAVPVVHLVAGLPGAMGATGATGSIANDPGDLLALYQLYKQ
jgi:hypothetical protein